MGPPHVAPGSRHSWLYLPLLCAAAGRLSDAAASAWRELPRFGDRWATLVDCLRNSAPANPHTLARLIRAIAELGAQEAAAGSTAADDAAAASLGSLPEGRQEPGPNPRGRGRHRGNGRRGRRRGARLVQGASTPPQAASDEALPEVAGGGASSDDAAGTPHTAPAPGPIPGAAPHSLDDYIDLAEELRHSVPTIQEVPPFLRGAVRGALVQALRGLQAAQGYDREKQVTRAWTLHACAAHAARARA